MSEIRTYRAAWILPITSPPVRDGAVAVRNGRVAAVGPVAEVRRRAGEAAETDLGDTIVLPGLTNAHTHLSLSALGGISRNSGFLDWLSRVAAAASEMTAEGVQASVQSGIEESWDLGTVLLGEITTRPEGTDKLMEHGELAARVYFEFLGVTEDRARERFKAAMKCALDLKRVDRTGVLPGLSPHAPYSVWPDLWERTIAYSREHDLRWSTHFGEPPGEDMFLRRGEGPLREFMMAKGVWDDSFPIPGTSALELLEVQGAPDERALLVHGLHLDTDEIARIAKTGASLCLCPRSNAYLGLPSPPIGALLAGGVNLCLGTDSKASNEDLSVWAEMRAIRQLAPEMAASRIVAMATLHGAVAMGMDHLAGSIREGLPARLVVVDASGLDDEDPAEYLVRETVEGRVRHLAAV
jgi:cytosine/adenosine deaminase-related metal-dependent hydrolase